MKLFSLSERNNILIKRVAAILLIVFAAVTLWISFSGYFKGNLQIFMLSPETPYSDSDFTLICALKDAETNTPVNGALVTVSFRDSAGLIFGKAEAKSDSSGYALLSSYIPSYISGEAVCDISAYHRLGNVSFKKTFKIESSNRIVISTNSSSYSPGDDIDVICAVISKTPSMVERDISISLLDEHGRILYSNASKTLSFGCYMDKVPLASMLRQGTYKIVVSSGGVSASKSIGISSVQTPDLKIKTELNPSYFMSGKTTRISALLEDQYGMRMPNAEISSFITEKTGDSILAEKQISGVTDSAGKFVFEYSPSVYEKDFLLENSLELTLNIKAKRLDSSFAEASASYKISDEPFLVSFIPEGNSLTPGTPNRLFVFTCLPDGSPVSANLKVRLKNGEVSIKSDKAGLAELEIDPALEIGSVPIFEITAPNGAFRKIPFDFSAYTSVSSFSVRLLNSCMKAGSNAGLKIYSSSDAEPVLISLSKDGVIVKSDMTKVEIPETSFDFFIPEDIEGVCEIIIQRMDLEGVLEQKVFPVYIMGIDKPLLNAELAKDTFNTGEKADVSFYAKNAEKGSGMVFAALCDNSSSGIDVRDVNDFGRNFVNYFKKRPVFFRESMDIGSSEIQSICRIVLSESYSKIPGFYFEDIYKLKSDRSAEAKISYYKLLFSYFFKVCLVVSLLAFFGLLFYALKECFASLFFKKEPDPFDSDDIPGAFIFTFGLPFILFIVFLTALCLMSIKSMDVSEFFTSRYALAVDALAVCLLFVYLMFLAHFLHRRVNKPADRAFINILSFTIVYIFAVTIAGLLVIISSLNLWDIWNYRTLFSSNILISELSVMSFLLLPVLTLVLTYLKLSKPENEKVFRPVFLTGILLAACFIFFISYKGYARFLSSTPFISSLSDPKPQTASLMRTETGNNDFARYEPFSSGEWIDFFNVKLSPSGSAKTSFIAPSASGKFSLMAAAFTGKGVNFSEPVDFEVKRPYSIAFNASRTMYKGDRLKCFANIKNHSNSSEEISVLIKGEGMIKCDSSSPFKIKLMPYETISLPIWVSAEKEGKGRIIASLNCGFYRDSKYENITIPARYALDERSAGGRFSGSVSQRIRFSDEELKTMEGIELSVYPGILSHYISCFDSFADDDRHNCIYYVNMIKISSSILDYLSSSSSEYMKRFKYSLACNVQNVISYGDPDGSFALTHNSKADLWITSSAVEALIMSKKHIFVDPKIIDSSVKWIFNLQKKNGSWEDNVRITSKVLYSLSKSGYSGSPEFKKSLNWLKKNILASKDPYALAYAALTFYKIDEELTGKIAGLINKNALHTHDIVCWNALEGLYSALPGKPENVQATALCLRVLLKSGGYRDVVKRAVDYIMQTRHRTGIWYSSPATADVLETLSLVFDNNLPEGDINVGISVNDALFYATYNKKYNRIVNLNLDKRLLKADNIFKIQIPGEISGSYLFSIKNDEEKVLPSSDLKNLKIYSHTSESEVSLGQTIKYSVSVVNSGDTEIRNLVLEIPYIPGFSPELSFLEDSDIGGYLFDNAKVTIYINKLEPKRRLSKSLYFKSVQEGSLTVPPASVYLLMNSYDRVYAMPKKLKTESLKKGS